MKRLMFYSQHVLGIGHLMRSLSLVEALKGFEIHFFNGGQRIEGITIPSGITTVDLPALEMDDEFSQLHPSSPARSLQSLQRHRQTILLSEWERLRPDIVILELFPFGRKRFAPELVPLLARNRLAGSPSKIVCSLRDILVEKSDQARHEEWVCHIMNAYFDLILVHSDPQFQSLEETFSRLGDLRCPLQYTGYVLGASPGVPLAKPRKNSRLPPLIITSVGGGRVGFELMSSALQASRLLQSTFPHRMLALSGPNMPEDQYRRLRELIVEPTMTLERFTNSFQERLAEADLSISMAGYNTCMNIISSGIPALVLPFTGHGNREQTLRATKLEKAGYLSTLSQQDLAPQTLRDIIHRHLTQPVTRPRLHLDTNGKKKTAAFLENLCVGAAGAFSTATPFHRQHPTPRWERSLRQALDCSQPRNRIPIFFRDDDSDVDHDNLRTLLDCTLSHQVPLTLAVIPGRVDSSAIRLFHNAARSGPSLLELHQHGWMHHNHESTGRKCEFGPSRRLSEQTEDIAKGRRIFEQHLQKLFFPAFTPPWNRCTPDTYRALDELGFKVLSKDRGKLPITGYGFQELSITLDLFQWKNGPTLKQPEHIVEDFLTQLQCLDTIGVLLHHKVMDRHAFNFLDHLFGILCESHIFQFHTFQSLSSLLRNPIYSGTSS